MNLGNLKKQKQRITESHSKYLLTSFHDHKTLHDFRMNTKTIDKNPFLGIFSGGSVAIHLSSLQKIFYYKSLDVFVMEGVFQNIFSFLFKQCCQLFMSIKLIRNSKRGTYWFFM